MAHLIIVNLRWVFNFLYESVARQMEYGQATSFHLGQVSAEVVL